MFSGQKVVPDSETPVASLQDIATGSDDNGAAPSRDDQKKISSLLDELKIRAGTYKSASNHFEKWYQRCMYPSIFLSAAVVLVVMMWPKDTETAHMVRLASGLSATNVVMAVLCNLTKFQSKSDMCTSASQQYDALVSKLTFSIWNDANANRGTLIGLGSEAESRDIEIRQNTFQLAVAVEQTSRDEAKRRTPVSKTKAGGGSDVTPEADSALARTNDAGAKFLSKAKARMDTFANTEDTARLESMRNQLSHKRATYMFVSAYYSDRSSRMVLASIVSSVTCAGLASGWDQELKMYQSIITLLSGINALLLFGMHLTKYSSRNASAESAASQFDALLTRVDYARKYQIGLKRSTVNALIGESERGMNDIAQHSLPVPQGIKLACEDQASKVAGKAK